MTVKEFVPGAIPNGVLGIPEAKSHLLYWEPEMGGGPRVE